MWSCDIHLGLMVIKLHEQLTKETGSQYIYIGVHKIIERNETNERCDLCNCRAYWSLYDGDI